MTETREQATRRSHGHIIERPRLTRLLDETTARVITLVAPAGYGKTTLARQWLANRPHVWYRATEASSDVIALAAELSQVFTRVSGGANQNVLDRLQATRDPLRELRSVAELQAREVGGWPDETWLAIDDYEHLARSPAAEDYIRLLMDALGMRLLIASRVTPTWATPRALLYGDVYELGRVDLAMRTTETRAVLGSTKPGMSRIAALANGWPALVGLARLTGFEVGSSYDVPERVFEYLADELYSGASAALRVALPQLALAPRITYDLAVAMFGPRKGPRLIAEAEAAGFFADASDGLRLHPLVQRFLLSKLDDLPLDRDTVAEDILQFFLARCEWDVAFELIRNRHMSCDLESLADLAYEAMLASGRTTTLETWLDVANEFGVGARVFDLIRAELTLRKGALERAERLALSVVSDHDHARYHSRALSVAGRAAHLDNRGSDALAHFRSATAVARNERERHEATWGCLASAQVFENEDELLATLDAFLARPPEGPDDVLRAANARLIVAVTIGGLAEATEGAQDALPALDHARDPLIRTSFLNNLSRSLSLQGRYAEARPFAERLAVEAQRAKLDFVLPHAFIARAIALLGLRTFSEAETALEQAGQIAARIGDRHNVLEAKNVLAKLAITRRDFSRALALAAPVRDTAVEAAMRAELLATRGLAQACVGSVTEAESSLGSADRLSPIPEIRALAASGRAVCRFQLDSDANGAIAEVSMAYELSTLDPIIIASRAYPKLAAALSTQGMLPTTAGDEGSESKGAVAHARQTELLTPRESEVLKLVAVGYTNREISRELFIAEVTAKVHVRNVIRKLGVRSRTEAAIAALRNQNT
jgi:LuxR family transcriptional regulator, maltose regulon positive regulatory protein